MPGPRARSRRAVPPPPPETEPVIEPPFYEAAEDLYVGYPDSGSMPMIAYHKGDRVVPDVIEPNGWGGKVRVPAAFEGQLSPVPAPGTASEDEPDGDPEPEASKPASENELTAALQPEPGTETDPAPGTPTEEE